MEQRVGSECSPLSYTVSARVDNPARHPHPCSCTPRRRGRQELFLHHDAEHYASQGSELRWIALRLFLFRPRLCTPHVQQRLAHIASHHHTLHSRSDPRSTGQYSTGQRRRRRRCGFSTRTSFYLTGLLAPPFPGPLQHSSTPLRSQFFARRQLQPHIPHIPCRPPPSSTSAIPGPPPLAKPN